jgi:phosphocarrier protein HPr
MAQRTLELVNRLGLHARAAAKFVNVASSFAAQLMVSSDSDEVNGKSILGLLLLAAPCGTRLNVRADGVDAEAALDAIEALIRDRFGEGE